MNSTDTNERARYHVGSTIAGRYRVERPIGEGAMGAVALARHVTLDEAVAVKFLPPELRRDPVAIARLSREAKALARIKSDHVCRVLDVGVTLSVGPYMVMEYLEGEDLGELLEKEGPLPVARAVECMLQVCEALTVAHTAGIVHRDIKPQNLFLARHGQFETLKILDFGIAEDSCPGAESLEAPPESGVAMSRVRQETARYGTPAYMSPERVRNDSGVDHRSDIWSVGVVLHELVTGRAVFDAATLEETCAKIVGGDPIELEPSEVMLPPSLRVIVGRCLERDPDRRFQTVEELAAALAPIASMHERFRGRSTGAFSRQLIEELARSHAALPAPAPVAASHGWGEVGRALRGALQGGRPRARRLPKHLGVIVASVAAAALSASLVTGVAWVAPPPKVRVEPVPAALEAGALEARAPRQAVASSVASAVTSSDDGLALRAAVAGQDAEDEAQGSSRSAPGAVKARRAGSAKPAAERRKATGQTQRPRRARSDEAGRKTRRPLERRAAGSKANKALPARGARLEKVAPPRRAKPVPDWLEPYRRPPR